MSKLSDHLHLDPLELTALALAFPQHLHVMPLLLILDVHF